MPSEIFLHTGDRNVLNRACSHVNLSNPYNIIQGVTQNTVSLWYRSKLLQLQRSSCLVVRETGELVTAENLQCARDCRRGKSCSAVRCQETETPGHASLSTTRRAAAEISRHR